MDKEGNWDIVVGLLIVLAYMAFGPALGAAMFLFPVFIKNWIQGTSFSAFGMLEYAYYFGFVPAIACGLYLAKCIIEEQALKSGTTLIIIALATILNPIYWIFPFAIAVVPASAALAFAANGILKWIIIKIIRHTEYELITD